MNKNQELLTEFIVFCNAHPDERFWQALRNWADVNFIFVGDSPDQLKDTFYWETKKR